MRTRTLVTPAHAVVALLSIGSILAASPAPAAAGSTILHGVVLPEERDAQAANAGAAAASTTPSPATASMSAADLAANEKGFAFYPGTWRVSNKKLKERLKNSQEWITSEGSDVVRAVLDGRGVVAEYSETSNGATYKGMSFYLYDPAAAKWSLFWADGRSGRMDPPLSGAFTNGKGEFIGDDQHEGRPVKIRFRWHSASATTAHWEQAFSVDQGKTWETNWVMELTRVK